MKNVRWKLRFYQLPAYKLWATILLFQLVGIVSFTYYPLTWKTNDDLYMAAISAGYYGEQFSEYLIFPSIILGKIIKFLSLILGSHAYGLVMVQLTMFANALIVAPLIINGAWWPRLCLAMVGMHLLLINTSLDIQFTVTASLLAIGAYINFIFYIESDAVHRVNLWMAGLAAWFSILIRIDSFLLISLVFTPFIATFLKTRIKVTFPAIVVLIFLISLRVAAEKYYVSSDDWRAFSKFSQARSNLLDAPKLPGSYFSDEELANLLSYSEYQLLMGAVFEVGDKFDTSQLEQIFNVLKKRYLRYPTILKADIKFQLYFIFLLVLGLYLYKKQKSQPALLTVIGLLAAAVPLSYMSTYRIIPDRVIISTYVACTMLYLMIIADALEHTQLKLHTAVWTMIFAVLLLLGGYKVWQRALYNVNIYNTKNSTAQAIDNLLRKHTDNKLSYGLICSPYVLYHIENLFVNPYKIFQVADYMKILPFGWLNQSPIQRHVMQNFGLSHKRPFQTAVDNDKVLFVSDNNHESLHQYLRRYVANAQIDTLDIDYKNNICLFRLKSAK